jgi:hypothetical protein
MSAYWGGVPYKIEFGMDPYVARTEEQALLSKLAN